MIDTLLPWGDTTGGTVPISVCRPFSTTTLLSVLDGKVFFLAPAGWDPHRGAQGLERVDGHRAEDLFAPQVALGAAFH